MCYRIRVFSFSRFRSSCLAVNPPAYPVRVLLLPMTLWQGMKIDSALALLALATALIA